MLSLNDIRELRRTGSIGRKSMRGARRPQLSTMIMVGFLVLGIAIVSYPTFSDWWNQYHQTRAISGYVAAVDSTSKEEIDAMLAAAEAYNETLLTKSDRYNMSDAEIAEYNSLLNLTDSGVMGYIQIARIGVNLPIYHGMDESVLQVAIGHFEGSSLPVGGPSTHTAVTGHRGLPRAKLFTDIDELVEGDTFTITVLDRTITYQVDQIRIVEPADMSDLTIKQDADFATLVTCTPYGINTHRLLVRGHRIENLDDMLAVAAEAVQIPNYVAVPAVAIPMLFAYLAGSLVYYRFEYRGYDRDQVYEELRALDGINADDGSVQEGSIFTAAPVQAVQDDTTTMGRVVSDFEPTTAAAGQQGDSSQASRHMKATPLDKSVEAQGIDASKEGTNDE